MELSFGKHYMNNILSVRIRGGVPVTEDDAAGMVLRPALNTGFSEMGWGSTPPSSAKVLR